MIALNASARGLEAAAGASDLFRKHSTRTVQLAA